LLALNPRTNHVHSVVVTGAMKGEPALNAFKGTATRFLREGGAGRQKGLRGHARVAVVRYGTNGASQRRWTT
jgi:hypothetical protein